MKAHRHAWTNCTCTREDEPPCRLLVCIYCGVKKRNAPFIGAPENEVKT